VDASTVVAYLLGVGTDTERERVLEEPHAPALLDVEVTQTLRGLLRAGKIDLETADQGRGDLTALSVRRYGDAALLPRAWELRDVCTVYDALYVALAEGLDAPLVTRDARLAHGVGGLVDVVLAA
jgi:predicted nucleic acid-binding protein